MKVLYTGPTSCNIKHGETYYIVMRADKHTPVNDPHVSLYKEIAFVHTNSELGNCIGTRPYDQSEWIQLNDRPGYKRVHICPNCKNTTFRTTAAVTQEWLVDQTGEFLEETKSCLQVIHKPHDAEIWVCAKCNTRAVIGYIPENGTANEV